MDVSFAVISAISSEVVGMSGVVVGAAKWSMHLNSQSVNIEVFGTSRQMLRDLIKILEFMISHDNSFVFDMYILSRAYQKSASVHGTIYR